MTNSDKNNGWISVNAFKPLGIPEVELEIAFWDGVLMHRCFGTYTEDGWYTGGESLEEIGEVIYFKIPTPLPKRKGEK